MFENTFGMREIRAFVNNVSRFVKVDLSKNLVDYSKVSYSSQA